MSLPVIGVMGAHSLSVLYNNVPVPAAGLNEAYFNSVVRAGGLPVIIGPFDDDEAIAQALDLCDGLLLPGGEDVDPRFYQADPSDKLGRVTMRYDRAWIFAAQYAARKQIPIFGICLGMQITNVAFGGSLYQDMSENPNNTILHTQHQVRDYPMHRVEIRADSRLAAILGETSVYTNTMHHQSVRQAAAGFRIAARASDGVVESLENESGSIILVQWHPEELQDSVPCMRRLFSDLTARAQAYHQSKAKYNI